MIFSKLESKIISFRLGLTNHSLMRESGNGGHSAVTAAAVFAILENKNCSYRRGRRSWVATVTIYSLRIRDIWFLLYVWNLCQPDVVLYLFLLNKLWVFLRLSAINDILPGGILWSLFCRCHPRQMCGIRARRMRRFSVRKQCLVHIEEFITGELTIGTVFLQQNRQMKAVMCLSLYSESIFQIKSKQVYNFLVTTAAQHTLCFTKFKYIEIFVA